MNCFAKWNEEEERHGALHYSVTMLGKVELASAETNLELEVYVFEE